MALPNPDKEHPTPVKYDSPWRTAADRSLTEFKASPAYSHVERPVKNMIIFIGDGMSLNTVTAARYLKAESQKAKAGEVQLVWDTWPTISLLQTFSSNRMTTDSGAAATAMLAGTKTRLSTIGLKEGVECCKCIEIPDDKLAISTLVLAREAGLSVGVVTTTTITHATPAAAYAHTTQRTWESSVPTADNSSYTGAQPCDDIASQLLRSAIDFNVMFGGGAGNFYPNSLTGPFNNTGRRTDGRNLLKEWQKAQQDKGRRHRIIHTSEEMEEAVQSNVDYVFGTFADSNMDYDILRTEQPSLAAMTEAAVRVLSRNPRGYLLLVEGGRIDHGHHNNTAKLAITDTLAFEKAVEMASKITSVDHTLTIVTADHSHSFGLYGYATRDRSIFDTDNSRNATDGMPFLIAGYSNGPGAKINGVRGNPLEGNRFSHEYQQQSLVPLSFATHSAEDVPLYAIGPFNEMFHGAKDNTFIAYATMFSMCIGPYNMEPHCALSTASGRMNSMNLFILASIVIFQNLCFYQS